jgi:signal transduction histidine kinase
VLLSKTLHSSTLKLALIYIVAFCAAIFAVFGYVYRVTAGYLAQQLDASLTSERSSLTRLYDEGGSGVLAATIEDRQRDSRFGDWVYLLVGPSRSKIAGTLSVWPVELHDPEGSGNYRVSTGLADGRMPFVARVTYTTLPDGSRLLVGRSVAELDALSSRVTSALIAAAALFLALAAAAGISTSQRSVARIEAINHTSRRIMKAGLGERIPVRGTRDEWDGLAANLNSMLDRIQELAEWNRQVSDNVAHDLRTPLTRLRGRLEKAHVQEPGLSGYRLLVSDALVELDEILRTFSSLLRISRIEIRDRTAGFECLDLNEITREVVDLFDPTAEERRVRLQVTGTEATYVQGDRDLLFDAISNLIDNAIKHGGDHGVVTAAVRREPGFGTFDHR